MATADGGPAFPSSIQRRDEQGKLVGLTCHPGLSLRDYFAGQALAAMADPLTQTPLGLARNCYEIAEAMIEVRGLIAADPLLDAALEMRAALRGLLDVAHDFLTHEQLGLLENYILHAKSALGKAEAAGVQA